MNIFTALFEMFSNGILSASLAIVIILSALFFIGFTGYLVLFLIDSIKLPIQEGDGILVRKIFEPEYDSDTLIANTPETAHWKNSWSLIIESEDGKINDEFFVSEEDFYRYEIGQRIRMKYSVGRILSSLYIKKILN